MRSPGPPPAIGDARADERARPGCVVCQKPKRRSAAHHSPPQRPKHKPRSTCLSPGKTLPLVRANEGFSPPHSLRVFRCTISFCSNWVRCDVCFGICCSHRQYNQFIFIPRQEPNDILYLPSLWWHLTLNIGEAFGLGYKATDFSYFELDRARDASSYAQDL